MLTLNKKGEKNRVIYCTVEDLVWALIDLYPNIEVENTKNKFSTVLLEYYIQIVELGEVHPELKDKIQLFISAKRLEGLSSIILDNYPLGKRARAPVRCNFTVLELWHHFRLNISFSTSSVSAFK